MDKPGTCPNIEFADVTARIISRKLKQAGFARFSAKYSVYGYDKQCEGFGVSRLGYSNRISIRWTTTDQYSHHNEAYKARRKLKRQEIGDFLKQCGYDIEITDHTMYVYCQSSGA